MNTRSVLTKILAKATLYLVDECIMICMGAQTVAFAVVSKWVGVLVCSNLRTVLSPPTMYNVYCFFLKGDIFIWMIILAGTSDIVMCMKN